MTFDQRVSRAAPLPAVQAWLLQASWRLRRWSRIARVHLRRAQAEYPAFALHAAWAFSVAFVVVSVLLLPARATGGPGDAVQRLMQLSGGDLSDQAMRRVFALDPSAAAIAYRLVPQRPQPHDGQPNPAATVPATQDMPGLTPDQARLVNAAIPFATEASPAAKPFVLPASDLIDQTRALDCLTAAVYYEAGGEPLAGQQAVAQVVLNRLRHPAFPKTVCGVVFEGSNLSTGCQFSFTCDGARARAVARGMAARAARGGRGARRIRHARGGRRDALSRRLCRAVLGHDPGENQQGRQPDLLPLDRRLGRARGVHRPLCRHRTGG